MLNSALRKLENKIFEKQQALSITQIRLNTYWLKGDSQLIIAVIKHRCSVPVRFHRRFSLIDISKGLK